MDIPTIPDLAAGQVVAAADLNNIADTCTFLLGKPMARSHDATGGVSFGTTNHLMAFTAVDFDTDGLTASPWNEYTIQTPGFYKVRYSVQVSSTSTTYNYNTWVKATAGPNNPLTTGTTLSLSLQGFAQLDSAATNTIFAGASGLVPSYLYQGDTVQVRIVADATGGKTGADAGMPNSYSSIEFVSA